MMKTTWMLVGALLLAAPAAGAQTPSPFGLELRVRAAFPTGDFGDEGSDGEQVTTGWGATLAGMFHVTPMFSVYAGYSHTLFGTDLGELGDALEEAGFDEGGVDISDAGFDAGVRATFPALAGGAFVRGGLVFHRVGLELSDELEEELEGFLDPDDFDSELSLGWQVGAGLLLPLGPRLSASIGAAYTAYEPQYEDEDTSAEDLTYASVEVGLEFRP